MGAALNRECLGRDFVGPTVVVELEAMHGFARAVDDRIAAYTGTDPVAHPLFSVRLLRGLMPDLLADEALCCDRAALVHGEQRFSYHRPLRSGDAVQLSATIQGIEDKRSGQVLRIEQRLSVDGVVAVSGLASAFIRGSGPCVSVGGSGPREVFRAADVSVLHTETADITTEHPRLYAQASGDHNPIHLDRSAAVKAGLPGIILHGTCSMALAARAIVGGALSGDPGRLRSLSVRFVRPVGVPEQLSTVIWRTAEGALRFETRDSQGELVLAQGEVGTA